MLDPGLLVGLGALFVIFLMLLYLHLSTSKIRRLASKIPGPKTLPIIGNLYDCFDSLHFEFFDILNHVTDTYGPRSRALMGGQFILFLADPLDAEVVFNGQHFIEKSWEYTFLHPWLGTGLLTSTGEKWRAHRKAITPAFHFKILENFISVFNGRSDILIEKLKIFTDTGTNFDVFPLNALFALDVMCETAMGVSMNVQNNKNSPYVTAVNALSKVVQNRFRDPFKRFEFIYRLTKDYRIQKKMLLTIQSMITSVIEDRRKLLQQKQETFSTYIEESYGVKKKMAFLDLLLLSMIDGKPLSNEDIRDEVNTFLFEGYDTTTSGLSFCLYLLAENPECQQKAFEEQYEIFGDDKTRAATYNELQSMKYLEMVLKETLRIYPSVPFIGRQVRQETFINDMEVPAGTTIAINVFCMHRNPIIFPNPEKFIPERFLPDEASKRNPFSYVAFSAGSRNCIGQKFVMLEMKSIMSKILRNYEIRESGLGLELFSALILKAASGVNIKLYTRKYK